MMMMMVVGGPNAQNCATGGVVGEGGIRVGVAMFINRLQTEASSLLGTLFLQLQPCRN